MPGSVVTLEIVFDCFKHFVAGDCFFEFLITDLQSKFDAVVIVVDGDCDDAHKTIPLQKTTTNETKIPFGRVNLV